MTNVAFSCSLHTDFITWRGHLTKIMCTPYETRESWQMAATLYNGTIFISEVETPENHEKRKSMTEKQEEMCYWGYNFESYVTSKVNKCLENLHLDCVEKNKRQPVNDSEAFITVIRTRLSKHSIVFGAEVDCCKEVSYVSFFLTLKAKILYLVHHSGESKHN